MTLTKAQKEKIQVAAMLHGAHDRAYALIGDGVIPEHDKALAFVANAAREMFSMTTGASVFEFKPWDFNTENPSARLLAVIDERIALEEAQKVGVS